MHSTFLIYLHTFIFSSTASFCILFGLPLGLAPSTAKSMTFLNPLIVILSGTWPYHCNLPQYPLILTSLSIQRMLSYHNFMQCICLTILISVLDNADWFFLFTGQVSMSCSIWCLTHWLYTTPLIYCKGRALSVKKDMNYIHTHIM